MFPDEVSFRAGSPRDGCVQLRRGVIDKVMDHSFNAGEENALKYYLWCR